MAFYFVMNYFDIKNNKAVSCEKKKLDPVKLNDLDIPIGKDLCYFEDYKNQLKANCSILPALIQYKEGLQHIWDTIPEGSLITNRFCLRRLYFESDDNFTLKLYRCQFKNCIVLQSADDNTPSDSYIINCFRKSCYNAWLTGRNIPDVNETYQHNYFKLHEANIEVHYTSNIELFDENENPICLKVLSASQYVNFPSDHISYKKAYDVTYQCLFPGIQRVIVGYHINDQIQNFRLFSIEELTDIAQKNNRNINGNLNKIKEILAVLINDFNQKHELERFVTGKELNDKLNNLWIKNINF